MILFIEGSVCLLRCDLFIGKDILFVEGDVLNGGGWASVLLG